MNDEKMQGARQSGSDSGVEWTLCVQIAADGEKACVNVQVLYVCKHALCLCVCVYEVAVVSRDFTSL